MISRQKSHKPSFQNTSCNHTAVEETVTYTISEIEDIYQNAWQKGYHAAKKEFEDEHNHAIEGYAHLNKVPNFF